MLLLYYCALCPLFHLHSWWGGLPKGRTGKVLRWLDDPSASAQGKTELKTSMIAENQVPLVWTSRALMNSVLCGGL